MGTCAGAPWEGSAPLGARRRRLREDRFGVPLPSLSGGKEVPWRDTAHALPVGGFLAFRLAAPPTALLRPPQRSGRSHEFSVTVGAEKTLVIVTGHGFEESRASLGWEKWRFLGYFCNVQHGFRAARQSSRYVISAVWSGKKIRKFRSYQGAKSVATFSGMSPAESTGGQGCDLYVSKWRRRLCFRKPEARSSLDVIFRRQALQARGVGEPKRAAQPRATRSHRLRSASLGAPLSDTDLETQAQKTVQVISLRSLVTRSLFGGLPRRGSSHALLAGGAHRTLSPKD